MSFWGQLNLMDPASWIQSEMILFHDHALTLLVGIFFFVALMGVKLLTNRMSCRTFFEAQQLETIWTVIPALLLILLALPSMRLLYLLDENFSSKVILKATGHQWYWSYEVPALNVESFDSYMIPTNELAAGDSRLLEVDNRVTLPYNVNTMVMTTSADVLHAWTIPSLGVKMDSVPGRLNSMMTNFLLPGVYYGQCSEICGANHSFMPIVVQAVNI
uniref:Cytochrome c oxidase subunit 2 n=1 Tax=Pyramidella dolabrata TaxID=252582 RepID=B3DFG2_9GAST|nr:cytochrome c oxidase subunit II [Pyramidella dolabrata]ACE62849.1 cytochrome c oxidase subunit II [Pyramidella dolabrata]